MPESYAHSVGGKPKSEWQGLGEHLLDVVELANRLPMNSAAYNIGHSLGEVGE